jgi:hypothetical protein
MTAAALTANVIPFEAGASVAAAGFLEHTPAFALDDGNVLLRTAQSLPEKLIVSFLVPNLRLQTKRGFSRFVGE